MKTFTEEIVLIAFAIAVYVVLPAAFIVGWIRWARGRAPETWLSRLSLLAFGLTSFSGLLALISVIYAHAIGGFPYYDPRLLRFYIVAPASSHSDKSIEARLDDPFYLLRG